jgi:hypothetical protein
MQQRTIIFWLSIQEKHWPSDTTAKTMPPPTKAKALAAGRLHAWQNRLAVAETNAAMRSYGTRATPTQRVGSIGRADTARHALRTLHDAHAHEKRTALQLQKACALLSLDAENGPP